MAKSETKAEMVKPAADQFLQNAKRVEAMSTSEQFKALQELIGGDSMADLEVIVAGKLPFWPALAGAMLVGTLENVNDIDTKFGSVGVYTVSVDKPCLAGNADGELFELRPGELITVLERTVMKALRTHVGQKVGIVCTGKAHSKNGFDYYDYRIVGKRRTAEEKQLNAAPNGQ